MNTNEKSQTLDFTRLTGHGVKVAVIDSGIEPNHPKIGAIAGGVGLCAVAGGGIQREDDFSDRAGHGTACAGIIRKLAPEATLYGIRIFDESLATDGQSLVAAIAWAIEEGMDVVNLSLGTIDPAYKRPLAEICRKAVAANVILVGSQHNEGMESYPAELSDVIGVTWGKIYDRYGYYYRPGQAIECVARGDQQRLCWLNGGETITGGTSFAAPHISAIVALIRHHFPAAGLTEVREILAANALESEAHGTGTVASDTPVELPGFPSFEWIGRAALYPYNKEMHALVRHAKHLHFTITGIADPVGKGLVGKDAGEAIGIEPLGVRIVPKLRDALKGADTLVLGYVDQLSRLGKKDLLREAIQTALERGLNVFSFLAVDPETYADLYDLARSKGLRLEFPDFDFADVQRCLAAQDSERAVDVPVIGVFGTSSQQGKFTLQLALRQKLIEQGYNVGQLGTEHHSALFGMDFSFPMGYAAPRDLPLQYYGPYLDHKMREINAAKKPDIMLVGCQSGTIPYDVVNKNSHTEPSIHFLLGTKPDACILVVNSTDSDAYIQDTIDGIRILGKAPVVLLAMSDKEKHARSVYGKTWISSRQMSEGEIRDHLQRLEASFGLPAVAIVAEEGQQRMVDIVVNHFVAERGPVAAEIKKAG